jgi:hypothetical protein
MAHFADRKKQIRIAQFKTDHALSGHSSSRPPQQMREKIGRLGWRPGLDF